MCSWAAGSRVFVRLRGSRPTIPTHAAYRQERPDSTAGQPQHVQPTDEWSLANVARQEV